MDQNTWLWIVQGVLAVFFGPPGVMLVVTGKLPRAEDALAAPVVRFIGVAEIAGAIAMVLPIVLDILPWLTPLAAVGFFVIMVLASGFHARRGEYFMLPITGIAALLSAIVVWGRWDLFAG